MIVRNKTTHSRKLMARLLTQQSCRDGYQSSSHSGRKVRCVSLRVSDRSDIGRFIGPKSQAIINAEIRRKRKEV